TSITANITIIDNIIRAMPKLLDKIREYKGKSKEELQKIIENYDNKQVLRESILFIRDRLLQLSKDL
ncbi:MAG: phosphopantothenate/pantothenate synthetase family protein, partial [Sulfolobales archaeon]